MDNILDDLEIQIHRCDAATRSFQESPLRQTVQKMLAAVNDIAESTTIT
jgi:hypothetical protein